MSYAFYTAMLRFIAGRTEVAGDPRAAAMMSELTLAADAIDRGGAVTVPAGRLEIAARAFAGVAGVLQRQVLPSAVAEGNAAGERQIRWAVDASMEVMRTLLTAAAEGVGQDIRVDLPAPPG